MIIVFIVTDATTAEHFLGRSGQFDALRQRGAEVHLICSPAKSLAVVAKQHNVFCHELMMSRSLSPMSDFLSTIRLTRLLRRINPCIVVASTPKAGLLGMIASQITGTSRRVYHVRGLRFETTTGIMRQVLLSAEYIACRFATEVVGNSLSLLEELDSKGICPRDRSIILGSGAACGVDLTRFSVAAKTTLRRNQVREELGISESTVVLGFVGRLSLDKGVADLIQAYKALRKKHDVCLVIAGELDRSNPVGEEVRNTLMYDNDVRHLGHVNNTEEILPAFDIFAFPSYREGLPNSVLEASAMELPVAGYRATGVVDAVRDGDTGTLVALRDIKALTDALESYITDSSLRERHGIAGREMVSREFARERVLAQWVSYLTEPENCSERESNASTESRSVA